MTKKRFEYYMTDKRFVIKPSAIVTDGFVIIDKEKKYTFPVLDSTLNYMFCKALNELHEENENLKDVNVQCCNDYSAMRRDVLQYKEENEQLKKEILWWKYRCGEDISGDVE